MIDIIQFRSEIVRPVLKHLDMWSMSAENLIVGTALIESRLVYLRQIGTGPALGIMQMEPATHDWLWNDYLKRKVKINYKASRILSSWNKNKAQEMIGNLNYSVAMARIKYWTIPDPLPHHDHIVQMADYWKKYYNTAKGKGSAEEFVRIYLEHNHTYRK